MLQLIAVVDRGKQHHALHVRTGEWLISLLEQHLAAAGKPTTALTSQMVKDLLDQLMSADETVHAGSDRIVQVCTVFIILGLF